TGLTTLPLIRCTVFAWKVHTNPPQAPGEPAARIGFGWERPQRSREPRWSRRAPRCRGGELVGNQGCFRGKYCGNVGTAQLGVVNVRLGTARGRGGFRYMMAAMSRGDDPPCPLTAIWREYGEPLLPSLSAGPLDGLTVAVKDL